MLKFLTHKLRTHSLNEENVSEKVEERDSGTESDDEAERADTGDFCTDVIMKWNDVTDISMGGLGSPCACGSLPGGVGGAGGAGGVGGAGGAGGSRLGAAPASSPARGPDTDQLYDHHSSEEELEVINGAPSLVSLVSGTSGAGGVGRAAGTGGTGGTGAPAPAESRRRGASSPPPAQPEKRKWPAHPYGRLDHADHLDHLAASPPSDDDDDTKVETPVRFRTSPPLEAFKPRRAGGACACAAGGTSGGASGTDGGTSGTGGGASGTGGGASGTGGGERAPSSPRRRRLPLPPPRRHRPALDFDKMQQLKVGGGGVRSWRAVGGAHGGELSVFCW